MASDPIVGSLKLNGLIDLACFSNFEEFLKAFINAVVVELPDTAQGVVVSITEPISPSIAGIWIKIDSAGSFLGIYVFSDGAWTQVNLGACSNPDVPEGALVVCDAGINTTLGSGLTLQIPVHSGTGDIVAFQTPYDSNVQASNTTVLAPVTMSRSNTTETSSVVTFSVFNLSTVRFKKVAINANLVANGLVVAADTADQFMIRIKLQMSLDNASYSDVAVFTRGFSQPSIAAAPPFPADKTSILAVYSGIGGFTVFPTPGSQAVYFRGIIEWIDNFTAASIGEYQDATLDLQVVLTEINY